MSSCLLISLIPLLAQAQHSGDLCKAVPCFELNGGARIPTVAMGSWPGSYKECGSTDFTCVNQHARFAIENWLHIGGRHVDAANDYRTQTSVGEALASSGLKREDLFITTKCPGGMGWEATIQCVDDNMQMLQQVGTNGFGYLDLLLLHWPQKWIPICRFRPSAPECVHGTHSIDASKEELANTLRAMEELKKIGVVKNIGVSNFNLTMLQWAHEVATEPIAVNQVEWNPKQHDDALLKFCKQSGILLEAWSPLGGKAGSVLSDPVLLKIAKAHNCETAQVAIAWAIQQGVIPVVGSANAQHQQSDLLVGNISLSTSEMKEISALGSPTRTMV